MFALAGTVLINFEKSIKPPDGRLAERRMQVGLLL
jgi:hypothetical protein